jgi:PAS domain S-box-containing protein
MFANVIEAMVDAVFVLDESGQITITNRAAQTLTGYTAGELDTVSIGTIIVDDASGLRTAVRSRITRGDVLRREEAWLVTKTEQRIPISLTGSPLIGRDGALSGIVLVARDTRQLRELLADKEAEIGRRLAAEAELEAARVSIARQLDETRDQLLLADRRATLGTLAGGVGHELRNIAQIQVAAVDSIQVALDHGEDVLAAVEDVLPELHKVAEHVTLHGRRLLQLARPGPDHVRPIDLNAVVRDVVQMLEGAGKLRRITTVLELAAMPVMVTVNRTRIEQILVNLIANASDAISGDGTITIDVRLAGDRVVSRITDSGSGIAPDVLPRIFDPFFTTKPEDRGTGLGLPVVREIVQSYGGAIIVDSTLAVGTTFTFDLPASVSARSPSA